MKRVRTYRLNVPVRGVVAAVIFVDLLVPFSGAAREANGRRMLYPVYQPAGGIFQRLADSRRPLQAYDNYDLTGEPLSALDTADLQGCVCCFGDRPPSVMKRTRSGVASRRSFSTCRGIV